MRNIEAGKITEKKLKEYFSKVIDITKDLNSEDVKGIYESILMSIFIYDTNHVPCFSRIHKEKVAGMNFEQSKKLHTIKFKRIFEEWERLNILPGKKDGKLLKSEDLEKIKSELLEEFGVIQREFSSLARGFDLKEFVEYHKIIIMAIMEVHLNSFEGINKEELLLKGRDRFVKIFGKHYGMLECSKFHKEK